MRPLAARKSLAFTVEIETGLTKLHTDSGSLELRVGSAAGSNRIQIDVTDTRIGIDGTHLETIFDEFTQVDQSSTREHGGAGLGLAISRRLIRAMGGSLTVKSAPGRGSTFRVELPVVPPSSRTFFVGSQTARERAS